MKIGEILRTTQPDTFHKIRGKPKKKRKNKKKYKDEKINYKELMEDAPVFKRRHGALKQVR